MSTFSHSILERWGGSLLGDRKLKEVRNKVVSGS